MLLIARSIWDNQGQPNVFNRQTATSNVVASIHSGEKILQVKQLKLIFISSKKGKLSYENESWFV